MIPANHIEKYFLGILQQKQNKDETSWSSNPDTDNIVNKIAYTCQVLVALKDCFQTNEISLGLAKNAITFLENTHAGSKHHDLLLKYHALFKWPELIPVNNYLSKLVSFLADNYGVIGGRLNAESFELCLIHELLLFCDLNSALPSSIKQKYLSQLLYYLDQPPEIIKDFSHYLWAINLNYQLNKQGKKDRLNRIITILQSREIKNGYWILDGIKERTSATPASRSDQFFTGYLIINLSQILKNINFNDVIYDYTRKAVETILSDFDMNYQWPTHSYLSGIIKRDIYQTCLFLRALNEFSKINDESKSFVWGFLENSLNNFDFEKFNKPCRPEAKSVRGAQNYVVYLPRPSGIRSERIIVTEDEVHLNYLSKKDKFDIIIFLDNAEIKIESRKRGKIVVKFKSLTFNPNVVILLVLFLKYKNINLPFLQLYHCAWEGSIHHKNTEDTDEIINDLKNAVSEIRKLKYLIKGFDIPNAKRKTNKYVCQGDFTYCLILTTSLDNQYTLLVD